MEEMKWNSDYMVSIYHQVGWDEEEFPFTLLGLYCFLEGKGLFIDVYKRNEKFMWDGGCIDDMDQYSEDFTEYDTYDDAMEAAIVESACYLLNKIKK